jgi:hypothetical protein
VNKVTCLVNSRESIHKSVNWPQSVSIGKSKGEGEKAISLRATMTGPKYRHFDRLSLVRWLNGEGIGLHMRTQMGWAETTDKAPGCRHSVANAALHASEIWFLRASEAVVPPLERMFAIRVYMLPKLQAYMQSSMFKNPASRTAWHVKSVIWASSTMKSTSRMVLSRGRFLGG